MTDRPRPDAAAGAPSGGGPAAGRWSELDRPPLRLEPLRRALTPPAGPFARIELLDRVESTNAVLAARAGGEDWPDLSVLTTDHQSAGRGRLDRTWTTPARAALATSVLLRPGPAVPASTWSWLPLLGGLAVVDALRAVGGLDAVLKWPNDVLVPAEGPGSRPAKVCGVLTEVVGTPQGPAVVLGFGVNVLQRSSELPVATATSLRLAGSASTDRDTVLRACLRALAGRYATWRDAAGEVAATGLAAAVREACGTLGQDVRVELPGGVPALVGRAEGLDDDGRLLVRAGSDVVAVAAGDVVHLRPAGPEQR